MVHVPLLTAVITPEEETRAIFDDDDDQVISLLLSLGVSSGITVYVNPTFTSTDDGTENELNLSNTVIVAFADTFSETAASMVAVPLDTAVTTPLVSIVATLGFDEFHFISALEPEGEKDGDNENVSPTVNVILDGDISILVGALGWAVSEHLNSITSLFF